MFSTTREVTGQRESDGVVVKVPEGTRLSDVYDMSFMGFSFGAIAHCVQNGRVKVSLIGGDITALGNGK